LLGDYLAPGETTGRKKSVKVAFKDNEDAVFYTGK